MAYSLRNRNLSTRRLSQEEEEASKKSLNVPKVSQFRRMYSCNSLQSHVIPEEEDTARIKRIMFSHNKSSSDPTRKTSYPTQDKNGTPWSHDRPTWPSKERESGHTPHKRNVPITLATNGAARTRHIRGDEKQTLALPTLPLFVVLAIVICTFGYLSDYLPTSPHPPQLQDYSLVWVASTISDKLSTLLQSCSDQWWLLGPLLIGVAVTTITLIVLNMDKLGGEVVEPYPSLYLGEATAVMNGVLMFLYFLFYNIHDKQDENSDI